MESRERLTRQFVATFKNDIAMQVTHVERGCCVFVGYKRREVSGIVELLRSVNDVLPRRANNAQNFVAIDLTRANTGYCAGQEACKGAETAHHAHEVSIVIIGIVQPVVGRREIVLRKLGDSFRRCLG